MNLAKWQQMDITMVPRGQRTSITGQDTHTQSIFDDELDNTALRLSTAASAEGKEIASAQSHGPSPTELAMRRRAHGPESRVRWKTEGPWVAGMSEDEFQTYLRNLEKTPRNKAEFLKYLRTVLLGKKADDARQRVQEERGFDPTSDKDMDEVQAASALQEGEFQNWIKKLRDEHYDLMSELTGLMQDFYDLPLKTEPRDSTQGALERAATTNPKMGSAPPVTHPSAGLSYTRTNAYLDNHPLHGPQMFRGAMQARVMRPRNSATGPSDHASLGMGGFVSNDMMGMAFRNRSTQKGLLKPEDLTDRSHFEIEGGAKIWVHADRAWIDESGRVHVMNTHARPAAVEVKTGIAPPRGDGRVEERDARLENPVIEDLDAASVPTSAPGRPGNANFGTGLRNTRNVGSFQADADQIGRELQQSPSSVESLRRLIQKHTPGR